ncbi:MAG: hypothetical protein K2M19_05185 [Muribaculaceae bacterium]|nr:hypothetical protein [Muribaculaceae bacterium]
MKKNLLLISALALSVAASARIAEVGRQVQISPNVARQAVARMAENPLTVEADNIILTAPDGSVTRIHPVDCAGYIWPSMSPDGSRVMFVAAGKGVYITDLEGSVLTVIPSLEAPVWVSDDVIAAMNTTDDGHQFSSSQIVLVRVDGSESQAVTAPESFTFEPIAAADGSALIYHTIDGVFYQVSLTLNK